MNILIFSDLHVHAHEDFSYLLDNGLNSRLSDCLDVITKVRYYAEKYNCGAVIHVGDLFHTPRAVPTLVFQETYKKFEILTKKENMSLILLAGNHDKPLLSRDSKPASSVYAFNKLPRTHVVAAGPKSIGIEFNDGSKPLIVHAVPFYEDGKLVKKYIKGFNIDHRLSSLLIFHQGVSEATVGPNEIRLDCAMGVKDLRTKDFDYIFAGHYHHPQRLSDNMMMVGSPIQHNMLDRDSKRGIIIYDTEKKSVKRIWLKGTNFHLFEVNGHSDVDRLKQFLPEFEDDYVRILIKTKIVLLSVLEGIMKRSKARRYEIRLAITSETKTRNEELTSSVIGKQGTVSDTMDT
ncbi:hypothetical protein LCGC14_2389760, partial [marine sediment metagenome]